jgi:NMD protein affecting ribosome stability and mRNA decay
VSRPTDAASPAGCTCPLIVGQALPQSCPHCRRLAVQAAEAECRARVRRRAARDLGRFLQQLAASVTARLR